METLNSHPDRFVGSHPLIGRQAPDSLYLGMSTCSEECARGIKVYAPQAARPALYTVYKLVLLDTLELAAKILNATELLSWPGPEMA